MNDKTPLHNLKSVIKETGLTADTLRAWERRYGLPNPERTPGRHRLYSEYDIATLKWLMARQDEGLRISQAVELWNELISEGRDPIEESKTPPPTTMELSGSLPLEELRSNWVSACKKFDETRAEQFLTQAFALYSPEIVCTEVLQKGLAQIGSEWYIGEASVQQEHFASGLATRRINALISTAPPPTRPDHVIVACPPNEDHAFSPLLITLFLRRRGIGVNYLGTNVPLDRMIQTVEQVRPKLVVFSAQLLKTASTLKEVSQTLHTHNIPVAFGGRIFNIIPGLRDQIPGIFLGEKLTDAITAVEEILVSRSKTASLPAQAQQGQSLLEQFVLYRAAIDADIYSKYYDLGFPISILKIAVDNLGDTIAASLNLADISYGNFEIAWLVNMLTRKPGDQTQVNQFLQVYAQGIEKLLGDQGKPIVDWLTQVQEMDHEYSN